MIKSILRNEGYQTILFVSTLGGFTLGTCNGIAQIKKNNPKILNNYSNLNYKNENISNKITNNVYDLSYNVAKYTSYGFIYGLTFPVSVPMSMYLLSDINHEI